MNHTIGAILLSIIATAVSGIESQGPWQKAPSLPAPKGMVLQVQTEPELQRAVASLQSGTTIFLAAGTYNLTKTLHLHGELKNIAIRGATGKRDDVILQGKGMRNEQYGNVPHGILVSDATDVLIADLSVGDVWFHPIALA